jgi:hypothetical protein
LTVSVLEVGGALLALAVLAVVVVVALEDPLLQLDLPKV